MLTAAQISQVREYFAQMREKGTWVEVADQLKIQSKVLRKKWKSQVGPYPAGYFQMVDRVPVLSDAQVAQIRAYFAETREKGTWVALAAQLNLDGRVLRRMWDRQVGGLPEGFSRPAPSLYLSDAQVSQIRAYFAEETMRHKSWPEIATRLGTVGSTLYKVWQRQIGEMPEGSIRR